MRSIAALTLVLAVASTTATATASPPQAGVTSRDSMAGMMHGPASGMMGMPMNVPSAGLGRGQAVLSLALQNGANLALSAEQENALRKLVDQFGKESSQRLRDIDNAERELAALLNQEPADLAQADNEVRAIEKLRADLRLRRIQTIAEGRAALTPEQRVKLDKLAVGQRHAEHGNSARGTEEMQRFMSSERMPQAMDAMMAMAERMGDGDTMLGMVRMMEMMSMMGGGKMGMGGSSMMENPPSPQPRGEDDK